MWFNYYNAKKKKSIILKTGFISFMQKFFLFILVWYVSWKLLFFMKSLIYERKRFHYESNIWQELKICNINQIISKHSKQRQSKVSWVKRIHYCAIQRLEERLISWIWIILGSLDIQYFIKALHPKYLKPNKYEHELPSPSPAAWTN